MAAAAKTESVNDGEAQAAEVDFKMRVYQAMGTNQMMPTSYLHGIESDQIQRVVEEVIEECKDNALYSAEQIWALVGTQPVETETLGHGAGGAGGRKRSSPSPLRGQGDGGSKSRKSANTKDENKPEQDGKTGEKDGDVETLKAQLADLSMRFDDCYDVAAMEQKTSKLALKMTLDCAWRSAETVVTFKHKDTHRKTDQENVEKLHTKLAKNPKVQKEPQKF